MMLRRMEPNFIITLCPPVYCEENGRGHSQDQRYVVGIAATCRTTSFYGILACIYYDRQLEHTFLVSF